MRWSEFQRLLSLYSCSARRFLRDKVGDFRFGLFLTLQYSLLTSSGLKRQQHASKVLVPGTTGQVNVISHLPKDSIINRLSLTIHTALKKNKADIKRLHEGAWYYFVKSSGAWSVRICSATLSKVIIVDLQKCTLHPKGFAPSHRMPMCGTVNHGNMDSGNGDVE